MMLEVETKDKPSGSEVSVRPKRIFEYPESPYDNIYSSSEKVKSSENSGKYLFDCDSNPSDE
jgi:hypothetical protein